MSNPTDARPAPAHGPIPVEIDPDLIELIPQFLQNRRNETHELREAVERGDAETVGNVAHRLKGLGAYGFEYITKVGTALEGVARNGDLSSAAPWIDGLEDYLDRVEPREAPG